MSEEEIKEYLKRVDELELKLTDEDKDTYQWLLFGYNECARLLNEKEQKNKQLKEVIEEVREFVGSEEMYNCDFEEETNKLLQILDKANDSDD